MTRLNKVSIISIILFIFIQLSKIGMLYFFSSTYQEGRLEFYPKESMKYEMYAFQQINAKAPRVYLGVQDDIVGANESLVKEAIEVKGLAVNCQYPVFEPLKFIRGNFWREQAENEGRNVVVISKSLAVKLFNSYEVIGEVLKIGESKYQIIGVYEKPQDFIHILSDFGEEVIYFPITSSLGKQINVKSIWFLDREDTKQINIENGTFYKADDAIKRLRSIAWVSVNLLIGVLTIYMIKENIDMAFFKSQYIFREKAIYIGFCSAIMLMILKVGMLHIELPAEVLPPYNIFDLSYYWNYFKQQLSLHYKMMKLSETSFENMYWLITKWGLGLTIIQFGLCFPIAKVLTHTLGNSVHQVLKKLG